MNCALEHPRYVINQQRLEPYRVYSQNLFNVGEMNSKHPTLVARKQEVRSKFLSFIANNLARLSKCNAGHFFVHNKHIPVLCLCESKDHRCGFLYSAHDRGVDVGDKASKPVTTVQDCVSTFASMNPLNIFDI